MLSGVARIKVDKILLLTGNQQTHPFLLIIIIIISMIIILISCTVNPRFSPWGLIVNFENSHGGSHEWGFIRGRELIEKVCTLHGGLFETACFLHATIVLG